MEPDTRNILDKYKWWSTDQIKSDLNKSRSGFISVFINIDGDFNLSSGIRNMNWFNGCLTYIVGRRKWDRRGAVGTHHYSYVNHSSDANEVIATLTQLGYRVIAAEIDDRAVPLTHYQWPEKVAVIFGEEGLGLSEEILSLAQDIVYIPGRGSVRSLNVATTSGIFMYDYHMKRGLLNG